MHRLIQTSYEKCLAFQLPGYSPIAQLSSLTHFPNSVVVIFSLVQLPRRYLSVKKIHVKKGKRECG